MTNSSLQGGTNPMQLRHGLTYVVIIAILPLIACTQISDDVTVTIFVALKNDSTCEVKFKVRRKTETVQPGSQVCLEVEDVPEEELAAVEVTVEMKCAGATAKGRKRNKTRVTATSEKFQAVLDLSHSDRQFTITFDDKANPAISRQIGRSCGTAGGDALVIFVNNDFCEANFVVDGTAFDTLAPGSQSSACRNVPAGTVTVRNNTTCSTSGFEERQFTLVAGQRYLIIAQPGYHSGGPLVLEDNPDPCP